MLQSEEWEVGGGEIMYHTPTYSYECLFFFISMENITFN